MLCGRLSLKRCGKSLIVNRYPLIVVVGTECDVFHRRVKSIVSDGGRRLFTTRLCRQECRDPEYSGLRKRNE